MAVPAQRNITSGKNLSYWIDSVTPLEFETLEEDIKADVVVIGAGISGLTTAYCLLERGFKVVVLEDGCIGSGETGRTTAHLTYAVDEGYLKIRHMFGIEESRKVAESHRAAIDKMEEIVRKEHIDCNFRRINGYLFLHPSGKSESLEEEFLATQEIELPTYFSEAPPPGILPEAGSCIVYPRQATFHIMQYLQGLANAVKGKGGRIFTRTRAEKIAEGSVTANGRTVTTSHIVVATNTPVNDKITMHTKQYAYRTYVIGALIDKDALPDALWWDTGDVESKWRTDPYHYARKEPYNHTHDLLIVGGEDHKTGQAESEHIPEEKRYDALTEWTRRYFPAAREIVYQWSGQVMEPVD